MMVRIGVALVAVLGLAACGGGSAYSSNNATGYGGRYAPVAVAGGPYSLGIIIAGFAGMVAGAQTELWLERRTGAAP